MSIYERESPLFFRGILLAVFFGLIFWVGLAFGYFN
jgi:hypothetical protein